MSDIEEIKATLKSIEEVLFEGVTTCEELDSTANRIYNVVVKQRNQLIESLSEQLKQKDKEIEELKENARIVTNNSKVNENLLKENSELKEENEFMKRDLLDGRKEFNATYELLQKKSDTITQLKERVKELEGKVLKTTSDYPKYTTCENCGKDINWQHSKCVDCLSNEMGL